jgi:uncharacterized protein YcbX
VKREHVGTIRELWRYPVKSLGGEQLTEMLVTPRGALGDRTYALRELEFGAIMSARLWSSLLALSAAYDGPPDAGGRVRIELPDGAFLFAGEPAAADALSQSLNMSVRFEPARPEGFSQEEIVAMVDRGEFVPRRDFFDEEVIHVLASGTLDHLRTLASGAADFDLRRFRPNIYIDTASRGFVEDAWYGGELLIGGEVRIRGLAPAMRCAMTIHSQCGLPRDPRILETAIRHHGAYVGALASVASPGMIQLGDPVVLETG